jgi:hypothetical protein
MARTYEIIIPTDIIKPSCLTMGMELTIRVPKPMAVVVEQMRQGLASHLTACFNAAIFSLEA